MNFEIKHRISGAVLFSLETESLRLCVEAAIEAGAYHVIDAGTPNGWRCVGWLQDGWLAIRVGCRNKRLAEGREYWQGKADRSEVLAALDYVEAVAKLRGWPTEKP